MIFGIEEPLPTNPNSMWNVHPVNRSKADLAAISGPIENCTTG
jgi:hypothetical protein